MLAPKEMYALVEDRYGKPTASVLLHVLVVGAVCTALVAIVGTAVLGKKHVVDPALGWVTNVNVSGYQDTLLSLAITILLLVISGLLLLRYFKRWERLLYRSIDGYVMSHTQELGNIPAIQGGLASLHDRVTKLESHTDITGDRKKLLQALIQQELADRLTIVSARYGPLGNYENVTDVVRSSVVDNKRLDITVNDRMLFRGRPLTLSAPGPKELELVYKIGDGPQQTILMRENGHVVLPENPPPPPPPAMR